MRTQRAAAPPATSLATAARTVNQPPPRQCSTRAGQRSDRAVADELTARVWAAGGDLHGTRSAVAAGVEQLTSNTDWRELQRAFHAAAQQQQGLPLPPAPATQQQQQQQQLRSGGSPWGFALRTGAATTPRQPPGQPPLPGQPPQSKQKQQQSLWEWQRVQQFTVLGLGSIGALLEARGGQAAPPPARLRFRLHQLVLATALHQALLTGLRSPPVAWDPAFAEFDRSLLASLGFAVPADEPDLALPNGVAAALFYMPCCPRELCGDLLAANLDRLQLLTILGTSLRSHTDTAPLVAALAGTAAGDSQGSGGVVSLVHRQGRVCEVVAPDCAAHGVAVAVHMFRRLPAPARPPPPPGLAQGRLG